MAEERASKRKRPDVEKVLRKQRPRLGGREKFWWEKK